MLTTQGTMKRKKCPKKKRIKQRKKGKSVRVIEFSRKWSMPNSNTFDMKPIGSLLGKYLNSIKESGGTIIDPFARNSSWGTLTNDLNESTKAQYHMEATAFLDMLVAKEIKADAVILDPPYSPRQISECYKKIGRHVSSTDTQNARLYKKCKDSLSKLLKSNGIAITFGWNSSGFGKTRGFKIIEIMLIPHGGAHNDTIMTIEIKDHK